MAYIQGHAILLFVFDISGMLQRLNPIQSSLSQFSTLGIACVAGFSERTRNQFENTPGGLIRDWSIPSMQPTESLCRCQCQVLVFMHAIFCNYHAAFAKNCLTSLLKGFVSQRLLCIFSSVSNCRKIIGSDFLSKQSFVISVYSILQSRQCPVRF